MTNAYATCPASFGNTPAEFRRRVTRVARWTDASPCRGLLVYSDNGMVDPWALAQLLIGVTAGVVPLVGTDPAYLHPCAVARRVASIGFMYGRPVDLNFVAGTDRGPADALRGHDRRYARMLEYASVVTRLLAEPEPVTHLGRYYRLTRAALHVPRPRAPRLFVSGASPACIMVGRALGATRLTSPRPAADYDARTGSLRGAGIRLGVIARDSDAAAWRVALGRFPSGPSPDDATRRAYWDFPARAYQTYCPYLVGSQAEVAEHLSSYLRLGVSTVIFDEPREEDDLHHAMVALDRATQLIAAEQRSADAASRSS
ncbi:LLM class flavin-dependent oxidoreductase [Dactylosporangium sp. CA-139066]|uniref:LLM class flavin-dependent oxidoreductase n=1 Tax=Dactylosporangium sp. CA-139066 TaxID=3239930 RepID=UPI003D91A81F